MLLCVWRVKRIDDTTKSATAATLPRCVRVERALCTTYGWALSTSSNASKLRG